MFCGVINSRVVFKIASLDWFMRVLLLSLLSVCLFFPANLSATSVVLVILGLQVKDRSISEFRSRRISTEQGSLAEYLLCCSGSNAAVQTQLSIRNETFLTPVTILTFFWKLSWDVYSSAWNVKHIETLVPCKHLVWVSSQATQFVADSGGSDQLSVCLYE